MLTSTAATTLLKNGGLKSRYTYNDRGCYNGVHNERVSDSKLFRLDGLLYELDTFICQTRFLQPPARYSSGSRVKEYSDRLV